MTASTGTAQFGAEIPRRIQLIVDVPQRLNNQAISEVCNITASRVRFELSAAYRQQIAERIAARRGAPRRARGALLLTPDEGERSCTSWTWRALCPCSGRWLLMARPSHVGTPAGAARTAFQQCAALVWSKVFRRAACCNGQMLMTFGRRRAAGGRRKWPQRGSPSSPPPVVFELFSGCVVWRRRVPALSAELYRETTDE